MRIKHWQGYGCVNANKVKGHCGRLLAGADLWQMEIKVTGNHEWGLIREYDNYDVRKWLLDKFEKTVEFDTYREMKYEIIDSGYEDGVEYAIYQFRYGKDLF